MAGKMAGMNRFVKERVYKGGHMFTRGTGLELVKIKNSDLREF